MAMSHICQGCGRELARVRPVADPVLGLRIVVCPECAAATVRRRDAVVDGFRRARRVWIALSALVAQLLLATLLTLLVVALIGTLELFWIHRAHGSLAGLADSFAGSGAAKLEWIAAPILLALVAIVTGVWLTSCFPHRRRARLWAAAGAVLLGVLFFRLLLQRLVLGPLDYPGGLGQDYEPPNALLRIALAAAVLLIAFAGAPLGRLFRWIASGVGAQRRARYRRSRRRLLESA